MIKTDQKMHVFIDLSIIQAASDINAQRQQ